MPGRRRPGELVIAVLVLVLAVAGPAGAQSRLPIDSFTVAGNGPVVWQVTGGPDDAIWVTLSRCDDPACTNTVRHEALGRVGSDGVITEYPLPFTSQPHGAGPYGITTGPDGALWFTEIRGDAIGRLTTKGKLTFFPLPPSLFPPSDNAPYDITSGPDGALWFTQAFAVGRISTAGDVVRYPVPTFASSDPSHIIAGPDGALWFTLPNVNEIGRITTTGGMVTYPLSSPCGPGGITVGPDGALWFACGAGAIGRITVHGEAVLHNVPTAAGMPAEIVAGADGALWFTEQNSRLLGRITTAGIVTEFESGPGTGLVIPIASEGSSVWFAKGNQLGRIALSDGRPISTIAGYGRGGADHPKDGSLCSADDEAVSAKAVCLTYPRFVTVAPDGSLYYAETRRVRRIDRNGMVTTVAGSFNGGPCVGACLDVGGLAVDHDGRLYISDGATNTVSRLEPGGRFVVVAGGGGYSFFCGDGGPAVEACLHRPSGLAFDGQGRLYIADTENNRVRRVDVDGTITTVAGNGLLAYCGDGGPATTACVYLPRILAVNAAGDLFIPNQLDRIRKVDAAGTIAVFAGSGVRGYCGGFGPALDACFDAITGMVVDGSGNLLVGDARNNRVRMIDTGGLVTTVAGNGRQGFCGDGGPATGACLRGTDARGAFVYAIAPAASPDGGIVVLDGGNALIRKVDPVAALTTRQFASCRNGVGRLTLAAPAPPGGLAVALGSTGPVAVPSAASVRGGRTSVTFPIVSEPVADVEVARISATFASEYRFDDLVLTPIPVDEVTLSSATASPGATVVGTVTLACAAGPGDVTVTLRSGKPGLVHLDSPTAAVPQGATTASFTVRVDPGARSVRVPIYATVGGVTEHAVLTIVP